MQNSDEDFDNITLDKVAESGNVNDEKEDIDSDFSLPPPHIILNMSPQTNIGTRAPPLTPNIIEERNHKMCVTDGSAEDQITRFYSKYCLVDDNCGAYDIGKAASGSDVFLVMSQEMSACHLIAEFEKKP